MTQRNPMNDRYQDKDGQSIGKTRKSAARAKPKTKAASSVYQTGSSPKPKGRMAKAASQAKKETTSGKSAKADSPEAKAKYAEPDTPEYKKWRRYWWITIIIALVFTALSFVILQLFPGNMMLGYISLGVGYSALIAGIVIDLVKVRKIRKEYRNKMVNGTSKKQRAQQKAERAEQKKREEEAQAEQALKESERQEKKSSRKLPFGLGKKDAASAKDSDGEKAADAKDAQK